MHKAVYDGCEHRSLFSGYLRIPASAVYAVLDRRDLLLHHCLHSRGMERPPLSPLFTVERHRHRSLHELANKLEVRQCCWSDSAYTVQLSGTWATSSKCLTSCRIAICVWSAPVLTKSARKKSIVNCIQPIYCFFRRPWSIGCKIYHTSYGK